MLNINYIIPDVLTDSMFLDLVLLLIFLTLDVNFP